MKIIKVNSLREIDKLIAEHIFGWTGFWEGVQGRHYLMGYSPVEQPIQVGYSEREEVWYYSTDIKVAWNILDNFIKNKIKTQIKKIEKSDWEIWLSPKEGLTNISTASTPELAICLAALKTKGIKIELDL